MFDVHCDHHGGAVLLSPRRIVAIDPVDGGLLVRFRCWCGAPGSWDTTTTRAARSHT